MWNFFYPPVIAPPRNLSRRRDNRLSFELLSMRSQLLLANTLNRAHSIGMRLTWCNSAICNTTTGLRIGMPACVYDSTFSRWQCVRSGHTRVASLSRSRRGSQLEISRMLNDHSAWSGARSTFQALPFPLPSFRLHISHR